MKEISIGKRSCVYYDEQKDTFIKKFKPNFKSRLKFWFKLRRYPGENFNYISNILNSLGIKTAKIISYGPYEVETRNIHGISLQEYYKINPNIDDKYISLILILLKNNIYSGDLSLDNFIIKDHEIYVIDMEDYKYNKFFKKSKNEFFKRLKYKIPISLYKKIIEKIN